MNCSRFDSILVRLKAIFFVVHHSSTPSFDSILVRLKVYPHGFQRRWYHQFRFHTGSIKRAGAGYVVIVPIVKFRFHTGSIKRGEDSAGRYKLAAVSIPYWFD